MDAIQSRINDGPEYWLEADDSMSRDDAVLAAAELVRLYFQEQPNPLLVESEPLADAVNTHRAGSDVSPILLEHAKGVLDALHPQCKSCVGALARHASRVVGHGASNGLMMLEFAELFAEPTGVRPELLAFVFTHSEELLLPESPPICTHEQCVGDVFVQFAVPRA